MEIDSLPRVSLAALPTPVHELPRLSAQLGRKLLIKRDDLTGLGFGGNKVRKLELLMGTAIKQGADTVITGGAPQSNHCRQTAAAAACCGIRCALVLAGPPQPANTGNLLLDSLFGAGLVWAGDRNRDLVMQETYDKERSAGRFPYLIPYGGSNRLGAAAYALAMRELAGQGIHPDWIIFASSSGGTQAGLILGARLLNLETRIYGISVDPTAEVLRGIILRLISDTALVLNIQPDVTADTLLVDDRFLGSGYGRMDQRELEAIRLFARSEGILLDPVYTGRAAGGMLEMIHNGEIPPSDTILFWHTGGNPALFAYAESLL